VETKDIVPLVLGRLEKLGIARCLKMGSQRVRETTEAWSVSPEERGP